MPAVVAKVIGADFELANLFYTPGQSQGHVGQAAQLLLDQIGGYPHRQYSAGPAIEFGRRFLPGTGGSAYVDSDHLEINTPEHLTSRDHALHIHAGLWIARQAQIAASRRLSPRTRLEVLANNCDGRVSYGSHLNVLTSRQCFEDLMWRKPHLAGLLATHLVTSVLYTGQGMVGAANGRPACDYQLSQRADWFERLADIETMQRRPLINQRNEAHAPADLARLHIIYLDFALSPIANWLRAGTIQLVVALCEAGWADPTLLLDDPVAAASMISRDLALRDTLPLVTRGRRRSALEIQQSLWELASEMVASGAVELAVPEAPEILRVWQETLQLLARRDVEALAGRCDNWLKFLLLDRHLARRGLSWQSAEMKVLDLQYGSLDPEQGLFLKMAQAGGIEHLPNSAQIEQAASEPPADTRAFLRAHVLRRWGGCISQMDWSWIDFRVPTDRAWSSVARLPLSDPRQCNRDQCESLLIQCTSLDELVSALTPEAELLATTRRPAMDFPPSGDWRNDGSNGSCH